MPHDTPHEPCQLTLHLTAAQLVRAIVFRPEMCVGGQVRRTRAAPVRVCQRALTRPPLHHRQLIQVAPPAPAPAPVIPDAGGAM